MTLKRHPIMNTITTILISLTLFIAPTTANSCPSTRTIATSLPYNFTIDVVTIQNLNRHGARYISIHDYQGIGWTWIASNYRSSQTIFSLQPSGQLLASPHEYRYQNLWLNCSLVSSPLGDMTDRIPSCLAADEKLTVDIRKMKRYWYWDGNQHADFRKPDDSGGVDENMICFPNKDPYPTDTSAIALIISRI
ncbi:uncharacterized protein PAC_13548 [Phialocephala subalpina]|uniref:Ricin B lectin domain-containing protein n=1 Tax=Phialocephala subalpina TaxID=576137 RepID=A0A1L7XF46_9HELO|nr:uncharacterized protein PAC_13548 [Phialocephala subalpina]